MSSSDYKTHNSFKCTKCKHDFKINTGISAYCPHCERDKIEKEKFRTQI